MQVNPKEFNKKMRNLDFSANASPAFAVGGYDTRPVSHLSVTFLLKKQKKFLSKVIISWKNFVKKRRNVRYTFYGRITAFDLKSVKAMVRKDDDPQKLIKYGLAILFDFRGPRLETWAWIKGESRYRSVYIPTMPNDRYLDEYIPRNYDEYDLRGSAVDTVSRFPAQTPALGPTTLKYRIEHKEEVTLKMLRFLLKKGCNPNDKYFLANLIFKHRYHSRRFLLKIIGMCSHYGLDASTMCKALNMGWLRDYKMEYYIGPILDIHKERVNVKDNIFLCYSWASKKNLLKATRSSLGNLSKLDDDVMGVIYSFVYPFPY